MSEEGKRPDEGSRPGPDAASVYERMRSRMLRLFGRQPWMEDVLQSAFEVFLRKRHTFRGEGSMEAFADAIAINTARDWMRRQRRSVILHELVSDRGDWPALTPGPAEEAEGRDRIRRLKVILSRLRPKHRMAYLLYYVENRTVAEIASLEGASEDAIRKRIERARQEIHARAGRDPVLADLLDGTKEAERKR